MDGAVRAAVLSRITGSCLMPRTFVEVRPVVNRRDWQAFLDLPGRLHENDPQWIEPLRRERRALWSPKHPWFRHAQGHLWLARAGGRVVGSISAQIDGLHADVWGEAVGYFGQLEAEDDADVFRALIDAAASWLRVRHCSLMRGPFDLGINHSCGLLVDGFERPPMLMMGHAPPYYAERLSELGLVPVMDTLAYLLAADFPVPRTMARIVDAERSHIHLRPLDKRRYPQELTLLREIFNDAWAKNWGYVPFTPEEFRHLGQELKPVLREGYVQIAEVDGEAAGFIVALPNINELIADLGGRLLPLGWARLLWRLERGRLSTARVPLMGVRQRFQGGPLGAALALGLIDRLRHALCRDGIKQVELSWILETNKSMRSLIEMLGARAYKRYRIFELELTGG
jgi:GNAT superfamily N-acetyltransferase